jgi:hypothetical protein
MNLRCMGGCMNRFFPGFQGGKTFALLSAGDQWNTPSGIIGGGLSTIYYRSDRFRNRVRDPKTEFCAPDAVILCHDVNQGMYCHLVCALAQSPAIVKLFSYFAGEFYKKIVCLTCTIPLVSCDIPLSLTGPPALISSATLSF